MGSSRPARMLSAVSQLSPVIAGLSPSGQPCGELTCGPKEFCHVSTFGCRPCTDVCSPGHKNFQQSTCFAQCQATQPVVRNLDFFSHEESPEYKMTEEDHLHDLRYMRRAEQEQSMEALLRMESDLERLTILVGVMFCLLIVCFVWLAFHACSSRRGRCRRRKTGDVEADAIQLKGVGNGDANDAHPVNAGAPVISSKANTVPQYTLGRHNSSFLMATKHGDELKGDRGRTPVGGHLPGRLQRRLRQPGAINDSAAGRWRRHQSPAGRRRRRVAAAAAAGREPRVVPAAQRRHAAAQVTGRARGGGAAGARDR
ncbi:hypothetical protein FJT64_006788 [Amphibalanus amphitrite]|uniref:Uncharacterized protein n=1 Tax=Amphibalanus amphitrite TaxID=1232801 RepID=A0A6A4W1L3_AMPAM|nr:hypothetical protein FJT64_006788 [Amphibalanus amphitrite]